MRLYPPIYSGDSILTPSNFPGSNGQKFRKTPNFRAIMVQSNTDAKSEPEYAMDFALIEAQARVARSAWIGNMLKLLYESLVRKFERTSVNPASGIRTMVARPVEH